MTDVGDMSGKIRLYSQDYSELLFSTGDLGEANQFLRDSRKGWLPIVIDFGQDWKARWGGRLVLDDQGCISTIDGSEWLKYMIQWPNVEGTLTW